MTKTSLLANIVTEVAISEWICSHNNAKNYVITKMIKDWFSNNKSLPATNVLRDAQYLISHYLIDLNNKKFNQDLIQKWFLFGIITKIIKLK